MPDQWHYSSNGEPKGPVAASELKRLAAAGKLQPSDMIWKEGMADWIRAGTLKALFPEADAITARLAPAKPAPTERSAAPRKRDDDEDDDTRPSRSLRRNRTGAENDEDDDDDVPRRRRSRKKVRSVAGMWIGLAVFGGLLLVGIVLAVVLTAGRSKDPGLVMTYKVELQVQALDVRPVNLQAGNRYQFVLIAANQGGDMDMMISNNTGQKLAIDEGLAANAFIDFTAPYSGLFRISAFNVGPMPNTATITVTDKGPSPLPPNQPIQDPVKNAPRQAPAPPVGAPPMPGIPQPPQIKPPAFPQPKFPKKGPASKLLTVLPADTFPFIQDAVRQNHLMDLAAVGFKSAKNTYRDVTEDGGLLIGLQFGTGEYKKMEVLNAIRPIFLTQNGEKTGAWHGEAPSAPITVKAKDGYVVGGANISAVVALDGLSLNFVKMADNRLVLTDTYTSDWVGKQSGNPRVVNNQGAFIVGIHGNFNLQNNLGSVGFVAILDPK